MHTLPAIAFLRYAYAYAGALLALSFARAWQTERRRRIVEDHERREECRVFASYMRW